MNLQTHTQVHTHNIHIYIYTDDYWIKLNIYWKQLQCHLGVEILFIKIILDVVILFIKIMKKYKCS